MNNNDYKIINTKNGTEACYAVRMKMMKGSETASKVLPRFVFQLTIFLVFNRLFLIVLKPLRQPQVVANILTGILLGPTVVGNFVGFIGKLFPYRSTNLPEIIGNLALVYYALLAGLEIDRKAFTTNCGRNVYTLAISSIFFPFMVGLGLYVLIYKSANETEEMRGSIIWATALASTSFSDVASILKDLKLLDTDLSRLAMCSSALVELSTWFLFVVAMSIANAASFYALLSTFFFALISVFLIRPSITPHIKTALKHNRFNDVYVWFILGSTMLFGLITDAFGTHAVVGSFILGFIMPRGVRSHVVDKVSDFVYLLMMPFFFLSNGLQFDIGIVFRETPWYLVILVICVCFSAKIMSALVAYCVTKISFKEAIILGLIMNIKGLFPLIIINAGRSAKALNNQTFPIMVLSFLVMTCLTQPIASTICCSRKRITKYKHRSVESVRGQSAQFRILACVRSIKDASSVISLLEASNPTTAFPIILIGVHLVGLLGRSTSMLVVHDRTGSNSVFVKPHTKSESDQIMDAFRSYEKRNEAVIVHRITALSPYEKINSDLCSLAEEKEVALILILFQESEMPSIESSRSDPFQGLNRYVLENAPCSVGIFVDRGLNSIEQLELEENNGNGIHIAMIFFGGPDDRDALAYAWKMAGHRHVHLTVLRFLIGKDSNDNIEIGYANVEEEKRLDDDFIYEFSFKTRGDATINYQDKVFKNGDDTLSILKEMSFTYHYRLFLVGRGKHLRLRLQRQSEWWKNCPELGAIGDALASPGFASHTNASILVVQHCHVMYGNFTPPAPEEPAELANDSNPYWHPPMTNSYDTNDSK